MLWVLDGIRWDSMVFDGTMAFNGVRWCSMAFDSSRWQSMAVDGSRWQSMAVDGIRWASMAFDGRRRGAYLREVLDGEQLLLAPLKLAVGAHRLLEDVPVNVNERGQGRCEDSCE